MMKQVTENDKLLFSYNCLDVCRTWEVWQGEQRQMERMTEGWERLPEVDEFQQGLFEPVLCSMERGIRVDLAQRKRVAQALAIHIEELEKDLELMFGHPLNVNSPKQMKQFFFGDLQQPLTFARATKAKGKTVSLGKEQLWKVAAREPLLAPLVKTLLEMRSVRKFLKSFVLAPLDADGRMRTFLGVSGTWTFRMSSRKNAFFTGCLTAEAEVLTRKGWLSITEVTKGVEIVQWNPAGGKLSWVEATPYRARFRGELLEAKTEQFNLCMTPEHRTISCHPGRAIWREYSAQDLSSFHASLLPVAGVLDGGWLSFSCPKLLVMTLADGSYEHDKVRVAFKRARKIERFLELCKEYGIVFTEQQAREGYRRFAFRRPLDWPVEKKWGEWVLRLDKETAKEMVQEARYWDGHSRGDSFIFYTVHQEQASWFATLAHCAGFGCTTREQKQTPESWSYPNSLMWSVNVKPRSHASVQRKHWKTVPHDGDVYCVSVPSTYFLVRYRGKISITGNTNLQNLPKGDGEFDEGEEGE